MCVCEPACKPYEDAYWPEESCPNPECPEPVQVKPVGARKVSPNTVGLSFHCPNCPTRWYTPYESGN